MNGAMIIDLIQTIFQSHKIHIMQPLSEIELLFLYQCVYFTHAFVVISLTNIFFCLFLQYWCSNHHTNSFLC